MSLKPGDLVTKRFHSTWADPQPVGLVLYKHPSKFYDDYVYAVLWLHEDREGWHNERYLEALNES